MKNSVTQQIIFSILYLTVCSISGIAQQQQMENEVRRFLFEDYLSSPASYRPGAFEDFEEVSDMKTLRRNAHREWMESEFDLLREIM